MTKNSALSFSKMILALAFLAPATSESQAPAHSRKLKVYAECVLRFTTIVTCVDVKNAFFTSQSALIDRLDSNTGADLELSLTDALIDSNQIGYNYTWVSHLPNSMKSTLTLPLILTTGLDISSTLNQLRLNAIKGLIVFFKIEDATIENDATVNVKLESPTGGGKLTPTPGGGWLDKLATSPWALSMSASTYYSSSGISSYNSSSTYVSGGPEVLYSTDRIKVDVNVSYNYNKLSQPDANGGHFTATDTTKTYSGLAVYSLTKNWDVAVVEIAHSDPGSNIKLQNDVKAGVEWILLPFRTVQNRELAIRAGGQYSSLTLLQSNAFNHIDEKYIGAFAEVYFYWVLLKDKLAIGVTGDGYQNVKYGKNRVFSLSGSLTYQINQYIGINGNVSYQDNPLSLTFPGAPDFSNPIKTTFLNGQPGTTFSLYGGLKVSLGNVLQGIKDKRWSTK